MDKRILDLNFCILAQPKSGSTWLVHLLSSLMDENYEFSDLEKHIPITVPNNPPFRVHSPAPRPNMKNIKLIRNPFDSLASWKNYWKLRGKSNDYNCDFRPYYRHSNNSIMIRYEDLNNETFKTLKKIVDYLGWWKFISDQDIQKTIDKCSFENLQKYEEEILKADGKFLFYDEKAQLQNNKRFYNKAAMYTFKDSLSEKDIKETYNKYREHLAAFWPELSDV
jgi:hypothetical protein